MRISDWSSDVCSSDLERAVRPRFRARAVVVEFEVERVGHFPGHVEAQRLVLVARRVVRAGHCQVAPLRFEACRADVGRVRSEEHTSELQSLMRISYAVFCLKKKNKKQLTSIYPT